MPDGEVELGALLGLGSDKISSLSNGSYHHRDISQICTLIYPVINEITM